MRYVCSAFSLNMLANFPARILAKEVSVEEACLLAEGATAAVGHEDTARVIDGKLGTKSFARITVELNKSDDVIVGQYSGPRLPAGATELPQGATLKWIHVTFE